jgi:alpha-D-ribose 1-methylphosphonate 5-triphosphate synthase subunit PhnH
MLPGFPDPVLDSQRAFRALLDAMDHPGRVVEVPGTQRVPEPLHPASAAVCLTLADFDTPLWLDARASTLESLAYLRFHCGCRMVDAPGRARFAVVSAPGVMPPLSAFEAGSDEFPERSTTVLIQVEALTGGRGRRLTGPGIKTEARLEARGLPGAFWRSLRDNHALFPRGVDVLLTAGRQLAALPRTTAVES